MKFLREIALFRWHLHFKYVSTPREDIKHATTELEVFQAEAMKVIQSVDLPSRFITLKSVSDITVSSKL